MYKIKEVSEKLGIPESKIRYYDKQGLLLMVKRDKNNVRLFDHNDVELLALVQCFRKLGMSIQDVKLSVSSLLKSTGGVSEKEILASHKEVLLKNIELLQSYVEDIDRKIDKKNSE